MNPSLLVISLLGRNFIHEFFCLADLRWVQLRQARKEGRDARVNRGERERRMSVEKERL